MKHAVLAMAVLLPAALVAQVASPTSKHNLSVSGPGPIRATSVDEVCVFCHTPHNSDPAVPLWNQAMSTGVTYTPYASTTMSAASGVPTGSSKLCLSCHDGTVAIGTTISRGRIGMGGLGADGRMTGPSAIGADLSDDHPVSIAPVTGAQILLPPAGDPVKLDAGGLVQCRSCHDPHKLDGDAATGKFLVKSNAASALCRTCHLKAYWATNPSSHQSSIRSYTQLQGAHTGYSTVADNGCESCHRPHTAPGSMRLLKGREEQTCGTTAGAQCHGSSGVSAANIAAEFTKMYAHPVYATTPSAHDASESPASALYRMPETSAAAARHAECFDCHNPHAAYSGSATAPKGGGRLAGVWGIDGNGLRVEPAGAPPSVNEYEICYKCHGDSANKPQLGGFPWGPYTARALPQFNKRLQLDPVNPSYHPVEAAGKNSFVPSLIAPLTTASIIYCTDCHNNDAGPKAPTPGTGPNGPHGSAYKHLLVARYDMDSESQIESPTAYALCYKCHDRANILADRSFNKHRRHLERVNAPCSICHDPHGVSAAQGATAFNNSHLINFDRRFVTPSSSGLLRFEDLGEGRGQCYLTCHGQDHNPRTY